MDRGRHERTGRHEVLSVDERAQRMAWRVADALDLPRRFGDLGSTPVRDAMFEIPRFRADRGPVVYPPSYVLPEWLDSDPYGRRRRARVEAESLAAERADRSVSAAGGVCAPVGAGYDFGLGRPLSELEVLEERAREMFEASRPTVRLRGWWRSWWWPAVIRELRERAGG